MKIFKIIIIIIVIVAVILLGGVFAYKYFTRQTIDQTTTDWKTYTNTEYGFEVKYPENYVVDLRDYEISPSNGISIYESGTNLGYEWPRLIIQPTPGSYDLSREQYKNAKETKIFSVQRDKYGFNVIRISSNQKTFYFVCYLYSTNTDINICNQIVSTFKFITPDQTADWKTYTNIQYGFEFKYPSDWNIIDGSYSQETNTISDTVSSPIRYDIAEFEPLGIYYLVKFSFDINNKLLTNSQGLFTIPDEMGGWTNTKEINLPESLLKEYPEYNIAQKIISTFKFTK